MHRDACIVFNVHTVKKKFKFYSTYRIGILKVVLLDTPQVIVKVARLVLLVAKKLHSLVRLVVLLVVLVMVVVVSVVAAVVVVLGLVVVVVRLWWGCGGVAV